MSFRIDVPDLSDALPSDEMLRRRFMTNLAQRVRGGLRHYTIPWPLDTAVSKGKWTGRVSLGSVELANPAVAGDRIGKHSRRLGRRVKASDISQRAFNYPMKAPRLEGARELVRSRLAMRLDDLIARTLDKLGL